MSDVCFQVFVQDGDEIRRRTTIADQGRVQPGLAEGASNGFDPKLRISQKLIRDHSFNPR